MGLYLGSEFLIAIAAVCAIAVAAKFCVVRERFASHLVRVFVERADALLADPTLVEDERQRLQLAAEFLQSKSLKSLVYSLAIGSVRVATTRVQDVVILAALARSYQDLLGGWKFRRTLIEVINEMHGLGRQPTAVADELGHAAALWL